MACNFSCLIETEGHLKVTCSHVHCRRCNISEMVRDRDIVTTDEVIMIIMPLGLDGRQVCSLEHIF